jgi:hypothetical protein
VAGSSPESWLLGAESSWRSVSATNTSGSGPEKALRTWRTREGTRHAPREMRRTGRRRRRALEAVARHVVRREVVGTGDHGVGSVEWFAREPAQRGEVAGTARARLRGRAAPEPPRHGRAQRH